MTGGGAAGGGAGGAPNASPARPRVAVCLSGQARNARQNVHFLRAFLEGSGADVFFHLWDTPDADYVVEALRPAAHVFEPPSAAPAPPRFRRMQKFIPAQQAVNSMAMFYGIRRANDLKRAHEAARGCAYDVVVRVRLDFFTSRRLVDVLGAIGESGAGWAGTLFTPDMAQSMGLNDQFALGTSAAMDAYASLADALAGAGELDYYNPEYLLLRHVQRAGLRIRTFPFEYVLVRDQPANTFDLPAYVEDTRGTVWSEQAPPVPACRLDAYFAAKADSVELVDALDLEFPKVFRVRAGARGYVRYDAAGRSLALVPDARAGSLFYAIMPPNGDWTVVTLRPRELVMGAAPDAPALALAPDAAGRIRPDAPADAFATFFVSRRRDAAGREGVQFEWRPGFWTTPAAGCAPEERPPGGRRPRPEDEPAPGPRLVLQPGADGGLALVPLEAAGEAFALEYVRDAAAEGVRLGLDAAAPGVPGAKPDPLPVRLLWLSYMAARTLHTRGFAGVRYAAGNYVRKWTKAAAGRR